MKRWKKILCIVLVVLLALIAGLLWWQRDNLKAVTQAAKYSTEEIEEQIEENEKVLEDAVDAFPGIQIRPLTEEEKQAIRDGTLTWEEAAQRMVVGPGGTGFSQAGAMAETAPGGTGSGIGTGTGDGSGGENPMQPVDISQAGTDYDRELSLLIAEIYALREHYIGALDAMWSEASAAYQNLPEGQSGRSLASEYMGRANAMEATCDGTMDGILDRMEKLIEEGNGDESLIGTVIDTYSNEKYLKKAWYMSQIKEKGMN